jgi:hypothetical protein
VSVAARQGPREHHYWLLGGRQQRTEHLWCTSFSDPPHEASIEWHERSLVGPGDRTAFAIKGRKGDGIRDGQ